MLRPNPPPKIAFISCLPFPHKSRYDILGWEKGENAPNSLRSSKVLLFTQKVNGGWRFLYPFKSFKNKCLTLFAGLQGCLLPVILKYIWDSAVQNVVTWIVGPARSCVFIIGDSSIKPCWCTTVPQGSNHPPLTTHPVHLLKHFQWDFSQTSCPHGASIWPKMLCQD